MSSSTKAITVFSEGIETSLSMIDHGIIVDTAATLYPISKHRSERIFSLSALKSYFYDEGRIDYTTYVRNDQTKASSAFELSKTFETKVTASGQSSYLGASLSATAAVEYSYSSDTQENVEFAQIKHLCEVANVDMPRDTEELRTLLDDKFKQNLDSVSSMKEARQFVKRYGALFISEASWGGSLTLTTSSQITETTTETNLLTSLEAELEYLKSSASTSVSTSNGVKESERTENFQYNLVGIGGKPHLVTDADAWMESVALNPALVDIKVGDISELALNDTPSREFIRDAVEEYCTNIQDFFGNQLFLRAIKHFSKHHWKKKDMLQLISDHKQWAESEYKKAKKRDPGITNKKGKKKKKDHKKAASMGVDMCKDMEKMLSSSDNEIRSLLTYIQEAKASNQERVDKDKFKKEVNAENLKVLGKIEHLAQEAGTLGLSNTSISFWNPHHSRFLKVDTDLSLKSGDVTKSNVLTSPDESKFVVKVLDHAAGIFALYNEDTDAFLQVQDKSVKCTKVEGTKFSINFMLSFVATTSGIEIKSVREKRLLQLSSPSFEVNLSTKSTKGTNFLLTETG